MTIAVNPDIYTISLEDSDTIETITDFINRFNITFTPISEINAVVNICSYFSNGHTKTSKKIIVIPKDNIKRHANHEQRENQAPKIFFIFCFIHEYTLSVIRTCNHPLS
jgi:hypothetical protein